MQQLMGHWKAVLFVCASLCLSSFEGSLQADEQATAKTGNREFNLQTSFLHEKLEGAHRIQISGVIDGNENGAGKAKLRRDPNSCQINQFGDTVACTLIGFPDDDVVLTPIKLADPTGSGRTVYSVDGPKLANKLYFVHSTKPGVASRLVSEGAQGIQRVVALESVPVRKIVDPTVEAEPAPPATQDAVPGGTDGKPLGIAEYHAWQVSGAVILVAEGSSNTAGQKIALRQLPIRIFPPQYRLTAERPDGVAAQVISPFRVAATFGATDPVETVTVHDANGKHTVPVQALGPAVPQKQAEQSKPATIVTGVSKKLSLDEAINDAAGKLNAPYPDALIHFKVLEIHGELGGIAGVRELTVKIGTTPE